MRISSQNTDQVEILNAVWPHDGRTAAIILLTCNDAKVALGLERVFDAHEAPFMSAAEGLDWDLKALGDCIVRQDGVKIVVEGLVERGFMGMLLEFDWGETGQAWREAAEETGYVWLAAVNPTVFDRIRNDGPNSIIPFPVQMLKLDALL